MKSGIVVVDSPFVAQSLISTLSHHLHISATFLPKEQINLAPENSLLLIELLLPNRHCGLSLARQLYTMRPDLTSVIWSVRLEPFYVWASLESKIAGILDKTLSKKEMIRRLQLALTNGAVWDGEMIRVAQFWEQDVAYRLRELPPPYWQLWLALICGNTKEQICDKYCLAKRTLDRRISRLFSILEVNNQAEAVNLAWQWGLLLKQESRLTWATIAEKIFIEERAARRD